ncbi:ABC-2 family transporter protein [Fusibacter sp. 3D3]|uniref:ABC-2 family transporter protein n=1 Tax=Fusibacter sp. 3D3 TaxID=1048380 RepID=UPI000855AAB3|nr:ABC-2 family transporter protein [Fusibacter sp. 3D3]GAU77636.1 hypothetical protein F3D3_2265 [Fusibacter sp. 3D3]
MKCFKLFFTFIIPFGMVNYVPMQFLLGQAHSVSIAYVFAPLSGVLFLLPSFLIWQFGVSKYKSTGS